MGLSSGTPHSVEAAATQPIALSGPAPLPTRLGRLPDGPRPAQLTGHPVGQEYGTLPSQYSRKASPFTCLGVAPGAILAREPQYQAWASGRSPQTRGVPSSLSFPPSISRRRRWACGSGWHWGVRRARRCGGSLTACPARTVVQHSTPVTNVSHPCDINRQVTRSSPLDEGLACEDGLVLFCQVPRGPNWRSGLGDRKRRRSAQPDNHIVCLCQPRWADGRLGERRSEI